MARMILSLEDGFKRRLRDGRIRAAAVCVTAWTRWSAGSTMWLKSVAFC
jgi:hypothetical protein